jgi:hypothetical protein
MELSERLAFSENAKSLSLTFKLDCAHCAASIADKNAMILISSARKYHIALG